MELLPLADGSKKRCKYVKCSATYMCDNYYGTGNLRRQISTAPGETLET